MMVVASHNKNMRAVSRIATLIIGATLAAEAMTASAVDVVTVDIGGLIDKASQRADQFAVEIPRVVATESSGEWTESNGVAKWNYSVRVPTAVSLSFHASVFQLPETVRLKVTAGGEVYEYGGEDAGRNGLWSRISKGDRLDMEIVLPATQVASVRLRISGFQAGYRGLGRNARNHPRFDVLRKEGLAAAAAVCVENYQCHAEDKNSGPAQSTAALVISNLYQCSGTLVNNTALDETPYVLTARHCQAGNPGGGAPQAAASTTVYWNAVTRCGEVLGTIYDPRVQTQSGATTIVEQQDAWLIQLDQSAPVGAYFAGWDASGAPVVDGYTTHHALSTTKQFTAWFGQAVALSVPGSELDINYQSDFLAVNNRIGSIGPGASGSALFNSSDRLVGVLSLGKVQPDSENGVCSAAPASPPTAGNHAADFTSFGAVYDSINDATSTTGGKTLRAVLDPTSSGAPRVDGMAGAAPISFSADRQFPFIDDSVQLSWSTVVGSTCVASGGTGSDGWAGAMPDAGTRNVTSSNAGDVRYTLICTYGNRRKTASVIVEWALPIPTADLSVVPFVARLGRWVGQPVIMVWNSSESPCSIVGKNLALTNLAKSGSTTITETSAGTYTYDLSCGSGNRIATHGAHMNFVEPGATIRATASNRRVGGSVGLSWSSHADYCIASGGGQGSDWSNRTVPADGGTAIFESAAGTYTYTVTCYVGPEFRRGSVTVNFSNDPPWVKLSASSTNLPFGNPVTLSWSSNVDSCVGRESPNGSHQWESLGVQPEDSKVILQDAPGTYVYSIKCGTSFDGGEVTDQITVTHAPSVTSASISASVSRAVPGQAFTVSWSSTNAYSCVQRGGSGTDGWFLNYEPSGSFTVTETLPGTYTFAVDCGAGNQRVTAQTTVVVSEASSGGGSGGGGNSGGGSGSSGGGGALDALFAVLLLLFACFRNGRAF